MISTASAEVRLRNVFDQYTQPENRITHALIVALDQDRALLRSFLKDLVRRPPPCDVRKLSILEQQYPGEAEPREEELESRGVPDGWIFDREGWCVFIESKVIAKLRNEQIVRHRRTAERRGFRVATPVGITPVPGSSLPAGTVSLEWRSVYSWLCHHSRHSFWAARVAEYLEIAEAKLIESGQFIDGTLTMFSGYPFGKGRPFTYLEGKRVLMLAMKELRQRSDLRRQLGVNPKSQGRPAITGRQETVVWDILSLSSDPAENFTKHPHLTLGVRDTEVEALVTVPNAVNGALRSNLLRLGEEGFEHLVRRILQNLKPLLREHPGAKPWFRGVQRRYRTQRSVPFIDARIDFDLRTAVQSKESPKYQPRWLSAAYNSFVKKNGSNYQIQIGVLFPYAECPELRQSQANSLVAKAWLGCKPLIDLAK